MLPSATCARRGDAPVTPLSPHRLFRAGAPALIVAVGILAGAVECGAGSAAVSVSAAVLSKSICKFDTGSAALDFGSLDPASGADVVRTATVGFRCLGSAPIATFDISDDDGLHETAPDANRMRHATLGTAYLPYEMTLSPVTGTVPKNTPQTLTVTGTVRGADYQDVPAGSYADAVVVSILP